MHTGTSAADARRFKIKADAFYVRHDSGVWLRNNIGSFSIRGAGAYELVGSLFTNLDGDRSLADICAGLPAPARSSVLRLVDVLVRNGFVKEVHHPIEVPPPWMRDRYPAHLAFLDHHADRPVARMLRIRSQSVVCAGAGVALRSLLGALSEFGIAELSVITTATGAGEIADVVADARAGDPRLRWRIRAVGEHLDLDALTERAEVREAAQVLLAVDRDQPGKIGALQRRLRTTGQGVGVLGSCGDFVVAAPPIADSSWCWDCVRRAVASRATGDGSNQRPAVTPATIAALHLAQHTFACLAGIDLEGRSLVTSVEPLAPVVRTHVVHRHPLCALHDEPVTVSHATRTDDVVRPDVPASEDPAELISASDRIVAATTTWTDPVTGPLLALGEGEHDQLPLSASTCRVADPAGNADSPATQLVVCRAISPREARNQVVLFGLEWLAGRIARLRGAAPETQVFGAGWSQAEARYRAWLAASLVLPAGAPPWQPVPRGAQPGHPVHDFLVDTLAATGRPWCAVAVQRLSTGLIRAHVRTTDHRVAIGAGVDREHAVGNALARAVATTPPVAGCTAHLAPPADTWADALHGATGDGAGIQASDVCHLLPFLGGDAHLAALPLPRVVA